MTVSYRKKLIEVALPLEAINKASAREKSIRHGHPSTLHLWWARRPLAACRAVLFASLVDDPDSDPHYQMPGGKILESAAAKRSDLFNLIEELVQWENSNNDNVIRSARAEIARCVASRLNETGKLAKNAAVGPGLTAQDLLERCHCRPRFMGIDKKLERSRYHLDVDRLPPADVVNAFLAEHAPPVLDPFCGGGSIPLEAQRLGLRAYASDLNPVPVLITKALIEIPPKFAGWPPVNPDWQNKSKEEKAATVWHGAQGLAADVRYYGKWMRDEAEKRICHLYPKVKITEEMAKDRADLKEYVGEELTVIAWLWARTVASPNPTCEGAHVPLLRSFWLNTKKDKEVWIEPVIDQKLNTYRFEVRVGTSGDVKKISVDAGTKAARATFACILTGATITGAYADEEANGGRMGAIPFAVVVEGKRSRIYVSPNVQEINEFVLRAKNALDTAKVPSEPARGTFAGNAQGRIYGFKTFGDYFTSRQLMALTTFTDLVREARERVLKHGMKSNLLHGDLGLANGGTGAYAYADALATYLAFVVDKCCDTGVQLLAGLQAGVSFAARLLVKGYQ